MNSRHRLAILQILGATWILCANAAPMSAQVGAYFRVLTVGNETQYYGALNPSYQPWAALPSFTTASISSQDGMFRTEMQNGRWLYPENEPYFPSFGALAAAMQQPYTIALDSGLPTERNYHMDFEPGGLATLNPQLPRIDAPLHGAMNVSLTPRFSLQIPRGAAYQAILRDGPDALVYQVSASFSFPPLTLTPGREYTLDVFSHSSFLSSNLNIHFTTPLDDNGVPLPNWYSPSSLQIETIARFVTIPEPSTYALAAIGVIGLLTFSRRSPSPK